MGTSVEVLFERELERRGIAFTADPSTGTYFVQVGTPLSVSLENLSRQYAYERDPDCVPRFVEAILHRATTLSWSSARESILFALEPNDYVESSDLRLPLSKRVDRVPILVDQPLGTWRFIMREMLKEWDVTMDDVTQVAGSAMALALTSANLERSEIDGVTLGFFETDLPLKSPPLLAPNLKQIVEPLIGWPLHAVVPDQDFIYVWAARHERFFERVAAVVVREYSVAPHPVTTELFEIGDDGIRAIGAFSER
ncbi:MAG TPA: hypothetical protein VKG25_14220 [Bryobacteraceae bacterium]|nr:hypothetical protein [Bryobacteraceae bacterium]